MSDIFEKLGFTNLDFGNIQSVDEMTIVPILGDNRTENTSSPSDVEFIKTSDYGSMEFSNHSTNGYGIIPNNTMVISEQSAQDHAMSETGLVANNENITYNNSCCVQQSQGGYLDGKKDNNEYNILPVDLRRALLSTSKRSLNSYNKLWNDIGNWLSDIPGISHGQGHLEYFFKPFRKELEDFVAEFEPVENQLGALILFNNNPVGLEVMPNVEHWDAYWKWLVRGCYGAQLLKLRKAGKIQPSKIGLPSLSTGNMVDILNNFMGKAKITFISKLDNITPTFSPKVKNNRKIPNVIQRFVGFNNNGGGDILTEGDKSVYLSAVI